MKTKRMRAAAVLIQLMMFTFCIHAVALGAADAVNELHKHKIDGGLIAQVGSDNLDLKELGERFHVRLLLSDAASVATAQAAIDQAGLQGRFTASTWDDKTLPFADRTLNAVVVAKDGLVSEAEAFRALAPRGLLISPAGAKPAPVPKTIDDWTHHLYNASGNAVSKDNEVASPQSFRWGGPPRHLRSHNHGPSFTGLVSGNGRLFHFLDEGTFLYDKGGLEERWALVARDAFNGAFLWKLPLRGYGKPYFEQVIPQGHLIWQSPMSLNRRMVVQGNHLYAALNYREGPLSILDAATGKTLHAADLGGIVDEIIADGDLIVCRVRTGIPRPDPNQGSNTKDAARAQIAKMLTSQPQEHVVGVDAGKGQVLWRHKAPLVSTQTLAMRDGRVVFHNYEELVGLDARSGKVLWTYPNPMVAPTRMDVRNMLGNLLLTDGKVLWVSAACGGGFCLSLEDGKELWNKSGMGRTAAFFPDALRVINGVMLYDKPIRPVQIADGQAGKGPQIGDMLHRGHHPRCFPGKATERFLISQARGAEFIDLHGEEHMVNDWIRGACSLGNMPANGLFYVTPDPCSCYSGVRFYGFNALAATMPAGLDVAQPPTAPRRLSKGPAFGAIDGGETQSGETWPMFRSDARRTGHAASALSATLAHEWTRDLGGKLTQTTISSGHAYVVNEDTYELLCLKLADGSTAWEKSFPAALDGPPTIIGGQLLLGCRDGSVHSLRASDGATAWRFLAAPLEVLTLYNDKIEGLWPVSSSVLLHRGLIYAVAGRNSYLDGGIHIYALDPTTGAVKHHANLEGPRLGKEEMLKGIVVFSEVGKERDPKKQEEIRRINLTQHATGHNMKGAEADLLVVDEAGDLYLMQNKMRPDLEPVPLERLHANGFTQMGGMHMMANVGFLDDTMYHRSFRGFDTHWPGYTVGHGTAARVGALVVAGKNHAYSAKHFVGSWYPSHYPGTGNLLVADGFEHPNVAGVLTNTDVKSKAGFGDLVRTAPAKWETNLPIIVRALLSAPDGHGGERIFSAGIVEGKSEEQREKATRFQGPGKLFVHNGADGKQLAEYDLPACPVFDGMSAADGRLLIALANGEIVSLKP